jgi:hypothetical protein
MYFFIGSEFSDRVPQNVKLRLNLGKAQIRISPARVIESHNTMHVYEVPPRKGSSRRRSNFRCGELDAVATQSARARGARQEY